MAIIAIWPTSPLSGNGITISWGAYTITATSIQHSRSSPTEVDVTHMGSELRTDEYNTHRRLIRRSVDYAITDPGEVTVEYVGPGGFNDDKVGQKATLVITGLPNAPSRKPAFLTSNSVTAAAGELIKGTCTFRLSDE